MKLIHLSDLHLGKRINEFSMIKDQEYILKKIIKIIDNEEADAIIIAGDIYDKAVPPGEAVMLFDDFLYSLSERKKEVFIISGNHDSPERIAFASRIMDRSGIHLSPVYDGKVSKFTLNDEYGPVNIYMLPFIKPVNVRRFSEDKEINTYTEAVKFAVDNMHVNEKERNVIITHQFVTGARRSESEEITVGGCDNVDAYVFDPFDYVALGHIHSPQKCGRDNIRYCGTPLKYSFSESKDKKSVTVVTMKEKGDYSIKTVNLKPAHDMVELKGSYEELTLKSFYEKKTWPHDYVHITLTDEDPIPDAIGKLRVIYGNIMKLDYCNSTTQKNNEITVDETDENKSAAELFSDLFELQNNRPMSDEQKEYLDKIIEETWEGEL